MARVILSNNETFTVFNSTANVEGGVGNETLLIGGTSAAVIVSQTVERVDLSGKVGDYTYLAAGNQVKVFSNGSLVATIAPQDDSDGTTVAFADGSATLKLAALDSASLGSQAIGSTTAVGTSTTALGSTFNTAVKSGSASLGGGTTSTGQTFTLTTGIDSIVGSSANDTINAVSTFTALDQVDGGAGTDTFNVIFSGNLVGDATAATVKGVEVANLTAAAPVTAANVSGWTDLQTLNLTSTGNIAGVVTAATTDINVGSGLAGVSVNGGKNVVIANSTAGNISVGATTAAAGNVTATNKFTTGTVGVKGAGVLTATAKDGAITFTNGTSVVASSVDAVALATRTANSSAKTVANAANVDAVANADASGLAKVAAAAKVTALTALLADVAVTTGVSAAQAAGSIQAATQAAVTAKAITLADKVAIDAAFIAALPTTLVAAQTAAQALVTPLATAAAAAKAAADVADLANDAAALVASNAADAVVAADTAKGALVDGVTVTATTNTLLASASISGNYGATGLGTGNAFANAIIDASTLSNTLTTVTLVNAGSSEITGQAVVNVSATGQNSNVTVVNGTVGHTQTYTLSGVTGGTYTDASATTVNIVSNGSATNVLTDLKSTLATKVNLSGVVGLNFGTTTLDAAAVIDASANSGTNTITLGAGQSYLGGTGNDTVTSAGASTVVVDGGAGTGDTLKLTAYDATKASKYLNFETLDLVSGLTVDASKFTGSAFTSEVLRGGVASITGLTAAQASAITVTKDGTYTIGVTDATDVGQLDTVGIKVSDGSATVNTITLTDPVLNGVETLNLTATDNVVINSLAFATALTKVSVVGAGTSKITVDSVLNANTVIDGSGATGAVTVDASTSSGNGLQIIGSATKGSTLTGNDLASILVGGAGADNITGGLAADTIRAGEGNNTISGGDGANVITAGNGNNTVTVGAGGSKVTLGNGYNTVTGGSGDDTIVVGTGGNFVTGGAGGDTIKFGAHVAGVIDGVNIAAGDTFTGAAITSGVTPLTGVDVVSGLKAGDTIDLSNVSATFTGTAGTTIAAAAGDTMSLVKGLFDTVTGIWTTSAAGTDTLVVYDADAASAGSDLGAVVLVGTVATGTVAAGVLTLG